MVNKPATLYLEDARKACEYTFHNMTASIASASITSPCLASPAASELGTLRPIALVAASSTTDGRRSNVEQMLSRLVYGQTERHRQGRTETRTRDIRPDIMYGRLDTGYFFECHHSLHEYGSYISLELFRHISPRPDFLPAPAHQTLCYNHETYPVVGFVNFNLEVQDPENSSATVLVKISATVVPNIYPDLFVGRTYGNGHSRL